MKFDIDELAPAPDPTLLDGTGWDINRYQDDQRRRIMFRRSSMLSEHGVNDVVFERALDMERHADHYKRAAALLQDPRFKELKEQWNAIHAEEAAVYEAWLAKRMLCSLCGQRDRSAEHWDVCDECHLTRPSKPPINGISAALARARQMKVSATLTKEQWKRTVDHFSNRCAYCGGPWCVVEHATPLPRGGTTACNCLPACNSCNVKKRSLTIEEMKPADRVQKALAWLRLCGRPSV